MALQLWEEKEWWFSDSQNKSVTDCLLTNNSISTKELFPFIPPIVCVEIPNYKLLSACSFK